MIIKNTVYGEKTGFLDPKVKARLDPNNLYDEKNIEHPVTLENVDFKSMRGGYPEIKRDDLSVKERDILIPLTNRAMPARIYTPKNPNGKCLIFVHGGGFYAGTFDSFNHECRYLANFGNFTVVSLSYRLAPETPFPGAYLDVKESVNWIATHQNNIGFNDMQVYMTGDSAGGELCIACGLTDNKHQIRKLFPMYAALDITDTKKTIYHWQYSDYDMDPNEEKFIRARLNKFIYVNNVIRLLYPGTESVENPLISPVYAHDFSNFPDITIVEAEFDYYLQSNKYFAKKLREAGKNVEEVLYKGMDHGFLDRSGACNQSEDLLQLIALNVNR